ncbi:hypothetical protein N0B31_13435 [Salinirubellus salinus]|uniref:Uncharacterized protein n=1 Tax=Salinirubellus salinus TaxID=1364945 RepID=A0A9E7QZZ8_9EURY|nr:hypothetical protein [Salinirubellus salinus]UWM53144.1 hypothetical protein N0B31_13435 [Salinirubellus salinus]
MSTPSTARQGHVAALQWGLVQAALVAVGGGLLSGYYDLTTESIFVPGWVLSAQAAPLVAFVVGAYGGYTWVSGGYASTTREAHRTRVRFVAALVGLWAAHLPVELGLLVAVDSALLRAFGPPAFTLLLFVAAYLLAYRVDPAVFRRVQERLAPTGRRAESQ